MSDILYPFSTPAGGPAHVEGGAASSSLPDDSRAASLPPQRDRAASPRRARFAVARARRRRSLSARRRSRFLQRFSISRVAAGDGPDETV
jgi:hypothetical protein